MHSKIASMERRYYIIVALLLALILFISSSYRASTTNLRSSFSQSNSFTLSIQIIFKSIKAKDDFNGLFKPFAEFVMKNEPSNTYLYLVLLIYFIDIFNIFHIINRYTILRVI